MHVAGRVLRYRGTHCTISRNLKLQSVITKIGLIARIFPRSENCSESDWDIYGFYPGVKVEMR